MKEVFARVFQVFFVILFFLFLVLGLPFAWLMRDGLGPDSSPSTGWEAAVRTLDTFYIGPALAVLAVLSIIATIICGARGGSP